MDDPSPRREKTPAEVWQVLEIVVARCRAELDADEPTPVATSARPNRVERHRVVRR
jgi:hypothetical protein